MTRHNGFTLVETIVVVFMFSVGIIVITQMFLSQNRLYRTNSAELDITSQVRLSLDDVDNNVRQATATLASYSTYTASSTTLILQIQSVDSSNMLIANTYDYVVYYLTGTKLTRVVVADPNSTRKSSTRVLASNVSSLAFGLNNNSYALVTEVATTMTASETVNFQNRAYTGDTKSKLRN